MTNKTKQNIKTHPVPINKQEYWKEVHCGRALGMTLWETELLLGLKYEQV